MAKLELQIGDKTYDKAWVDDLSSTSQISTDPAGINYGVIPSTGNAKLRDLGGAIRADIEAGVLPASNAPAKVRINDNQIQEHTTSDSDYDVINRELNLDFSDRLSLLDKVTYGGMPLRDYSMSAYEMLDDVLGSYGGYVKEIPRNWNIYYSSGKITFNSSTQLKAEIPYLNGHVEKIGTSIKLKKGVAHKISFSIKTSSFSLTAGTSGLQAIITEAYPTATNLDKTATASANITSDTTNIATLEFTPTTDVVYFVLMLNNAAISQTFTMTISTFVLDGRSNKDLLNSPHSRNPYVYGSTLAAGSESLYNYLDDVLIDYPHLESASYRETIEKFCTLAQMTLSLDENGDIRFKSARPQIFSINDRTSSQIIDANHKISNFNKTLFLKNKVDGVEVGYVIPIKEKQADQDVYSYEATVVSMSSNIGTEEQGGLTNAGNTIRFVEGYSFNVPKKINNNLTKIKSITGIRVTSTGLYQSGTVDSSLNKTVTDSEAGYEWTMPLQEPTDYNNTATTPITMSSDAIISVESYQDKTLEEYWKITIINAAIDQKYWFYDNAKGSGELHYYTASSVNFIVKASVENIKFNEATTSTIGIESATNPINIAQNELMQYSDIATSIRKNILADYANGVQTGTQELFCGIGDWEHGEIMQPYDTVRIEGEDGYWRVTGRTFKYAGAPTLSLELQKLHEKEWNDIDIGGGISTGTISTGTFTANGEKTGSIQLPSGYDYSIDSAYIVSVVFNIDGTDSTSTKASQGTASLSKMNGLVHTVHCTVTADWANGVLNYVAEEKYRALGTRRSYVKSITVTKLAQFY